MTSQMQCDCGNSLRISEHHVGRTVQCPVCAKSHSVTSESMTAQPPSTAIVAALPTPVVIAAPPLEKGKRNVLPLVVVLLLALAGGAGTCWLLFRKDGRLREDDDLALIPSNAQGFISVRLADLWKTPAMRQALEQQPQMKADDPAQQMEEATGLRPEEIERLSLVTIDIDERIGWLVVRTVDPVVYKVFSRISDRSSIVVYRGERYTLGKGADGRLWALKSFGLKVLVVGTEQGMKRCLDYTTGGLVQGPLGPTIGLADMTTHTAIVGVHTAGSTLEKHHPWSEIRAGFVKLDMNDRVELDGRIEMSNASAATKMHKTIKDYRAFLLFEEGWARIWGTDEEKTVKSLKELFKQIKFEQNGVEIRITGHSEDGSLLAGTVLGLPKFLMRKFLRDR